MNGLVFLFAAIALVGAHGLRSGGRGSRLIAVSAFVAGLVAAMLGVKLIADTAGIGRTTDFDRVVNHAVATAGSDPDAPLILLSGASYSRNAVDDQRLTAALRTAGFSHRAINLSLEAASLPERAAHIDAFIAQSGRTPDLVFIEIARDFDQRPAQFFNNSKFSQRGIEQFGLRTGAWTLLGLAQGGCGGAADCVKNAGLTAAHMALNFANIGLVARGEPAREAGELASYDPQTDVRTPTTPDERESGLLGRDDITPRDGPRWISSLRRMHAEHLYGRGVITVGYYFPPVIDAGERSYAAGLCGGELSAAPCIAPMDGQMLAGLTGPVWLDAHHLLQPGAETYTDWLATRLIATGVLEPADAGLVGAP